MGLLTCHSNSAPAVRQEFIHSFWTLLKGHAQQLRTLPPCLQIVWCGRDSQAFLQPEQLDTTETWYCGRCKEHVQAQKKLDLWSLPELLVVHLKRFSYSRHSRDKLDAPVDFPLSGLDLSSFVMREQV